MATKDVSDLGALLNPNTSPNIHYLSPARQSNRNKNGITAMHLNGIKEEQKAEINSDRDTQEDDTGTDDDNLSDSFNFDGDTNPLNAMPMRLTAVVVGTPPNSTRQPANAPKARFNFKRLSQKLSDMNIMSAIADIDQQSDITEEASDYDDTPDSAPPYSDIDNDMLDAKQSHIEHLNKIIESLKFLQKELPHLVEFEMDEALNVIRIKIPNVNHYKKWDLDDIMFWIQHLENGRYAKYEPQLTFGFGQSDITAEDLPDMETANLGAPPFNIKVFRDKRDLIRHFKTLRQNI